jgi:hypothetical protein
MECQSIILRKTLLNTSKKQFVLDPLHIAAKTENNSLMSAKVLHGIALSEEILGHMLLMVSLFCCSQHQHSMLTKDAETKHFIYFYLGHCAILLFKTQ